MKRPSYIFTHSASLSSNALKRFSKALCTLDVKITVNAEKMKDAKERANNPYYLKDNR